MNYRILQQIRLWIYLVVIAMVVSRLGNKPAHLIDFITFCILGILPFLELCPNCRRLSWWERSAWPGVIWIGTECKIHPCRAEDGHKI